YLGIDVLKLPFIRATSLGHEVLHDWWGNGVYVDYARGNWAEGLTTFMADYAYREREGEAAARETRLAWLRDISAVPPGQDEPLTAFRDFWRTQRFHIAAWSDLEHAFEAASGRDLEPFFTQWLTRPGAPAVRIASAHAIKHAHGWRTTATLTQDATPYSVRVPLVVDGTTTHVFDFNEPTSRFTIETKERPREIALDPELRVLRRLAPDEAPPILRAVMVAPAASVVVLSDALKQPAEQLARHLLDGAPGPSQKSLVIGLHQD